MKVRQYLLKTVAGALLVVGLSLMPVLTTPIAAEETPIPQVQISESTPLFGNLGDYTFPISTESPLTQQYFNQGMVLAYGFNHAEAARSFQAGLLIDDTCAMCYWGLAYVHGPNINAPMELDAVPTAWESVQQAQALRAHATPKERALIRAMATRYAVAPETDRSELDKAYAATMAEVYRQYPNDPDVATLYAEALMDTMPWDYWDENGNPKPDTEVMLATLESVIANNPTHIGALHLYIHAVEKEHPELAETAADTLGALAPGAGHLVHMPSHIYIRIGRYHDAVVANQRAVDADRAYLHGSHSPGIYTLAYMPHNHHFAWFGALMTGQSKVALEAAHHTAQVDQAMLHDPDLGASLQHYSSVPLFTLVRFSRWDDILNTPAPGADLKYPTGIWHYAQGMALAAHGDTAQARTHLGALQALVVDPDMQEQRIWGFNSTSQVLDLASAVLAGEIALTSKDYDEGIAHLQHAIALEDQLVYTEPPDWFAPTRNLLGHGFLKAGRYSEAEAAFRADLAAYPENGWSLYGLAQSLQAQGKAEEATAVQTRFDDAWQYADTTITASL